VATGSGALLGLTQYHSSDRDFQISLKCGNATDCNITAGSVVRLLENASD
jgi:hypothetical protein